MKLPRPILSAVEEEKIATDKKIKFLQGFMTGALTVFFAGIFGHLILRGL